MKKVKCINNDHTHPGLEIGKIYKCEERAANAYWIHLDNDYKDWYRKDRFEEVKEEQQEVEYYKVIKEYPNVNRIVKIGEKIYEAIQKDTFLIAPNFPEFFRPVYKQQFKAGDMVTDDGKNVYTYKEMRNCRHYITEDNISLGKDVRLATPEEIERHLTITIAGYKMEIVNHAGTETVKFGCKEFTKSEIIAYKRLSVHATITIDGQEITSTIINKILAKLK